MTELAIPDPTPSTTLATRADLRNSATDSWTDVLIHVGHLAERIADTDFVPKGMRRNAPAVAAAILHGREVGFGPMTALAQTHVIEGRVSISAEAMRALVLQHGHHIRIGEMSGGSCTIAGRRAGDDHWVTVTWTLEDARRAGLATKNVWKSYPRQMLLARATTELLRAVFPDVIHGLMSTEELDELVTAPSEAQASISGPEKPKTSTVSRKRAQARQNEVSGPVEAPTTPGPDGVGVDAPPTVDPDPTPRCPRCGVAIVPNENDLCPICEQQVADEIEAEQEEIRKLSDQPREPLSEHKDATRDDVDPEHPLPEPFSYATVDPYETTEAPLTPPTPDQAKVEPGGAPVSGMQRGKIMAELSRIGVDTTDAGRDMRLTYLAALAGRDTLGSLNDLSFREAHVVINRLTTVSDVADLETKLATL